MTSPERGGSTQNDQADDESRRTPPADPWLDEAPTSVVGEARELPADTARFETAVVEEEKRRRPFRWVLAVLAACALFVAGMLAIDRFGGGSGGADDGLGSRATGAPTTRPAAAPTVAPAAGRSPSAGASATATAGRSAAAVAPVGSAAVPEVVYEVTASGARNTGSVSYTDQDGQIIRRNGIPLPWRISFPLSAQHKPLIVDAQRKGGGDAGPVTCTITVGGKVLATTTATGPYAAPECSG